MVYKILYVSIVYISFMFMAAHAESHDDKALKVFELKDIFDLEFASDPQISPDGEKIVYARNFFDIMTDKQYSNLWIMNFDGSHHVPITTGKRNDTSPRWSTDGMRLLYISSDEDGKSQIFCRWMDSGETAQLTNTQKTPQNITWSPDGSAVAFSMFVPSEEKPLAKLPEKPKGAEWAEAAKVIEEVLYRADGRGYLEAGYNHLFVLPAEGGTPHQVTSGDYHYPHMYSPGVEWTADSQNLLFSANLNKDWEFQPRESNIYNLNIQSGEIVQLTDRNGPDSSPIVSPDGQRILYLGYDDKKISHQYSKIYLMNIDGREKSLISEMDSDVSDIQWDHDGGGFYFLYEDRGINKIGYKPLKGEFLHIADHVGGVTIGRPYGSGSFSVSDTGRIAYTRSSTAHPADVAVISKENRESGLITQLNKDILQYRVLGEVESVTYEVRIPNQKTEVIDAWIIKPPHFDPQKKYPLILEIHGGPHLAYGPSFTAEMQLYAASGYVVLYTNPRGSTSYGEAFAQLIHHKYPSDDYYDLMAGVDAVIAKGYIDENNLFVTGGSGGGILTCWIVGKTDRFRAAVSSKPIVNWYSAGLTSDIGNYIQDYWFPGSAWENMQKYMERSPISYVGNVKTPTMFIVGEKDYRTPISEAEQFYQALKLIKVDSALVRIPEASHDITARPSYMISQVAHILAWFEKYKEVEEEE